MPALVKSLSGQGKPRSNRHHAGNGCADYDLCGARHFTLLDWLPKVISEMVGQTCRFAAAPSRAPPTISEMTFGNHSSCGH